MQSTDREDPAVLVVLTRYLVAAWFRAVGSPKTWKRELVAM